MPTPVSRLAGMHLGAIADGDGWHDELPPGTSWP
jgi:hypothetical protein